MTMYFGCWSSSLVWPCTSGAGLVRFGRSSSRTSGYCCLAALVSCVNSFYIALLTILILRVVVHILLRHTVHLTSFSSLWVLGRFTHPRASLRLFELHSGWVALGLVQILGGLCVRVRPSTRRHRRRSRWPGRPSLPPTHKIVFVSSGSSRHERAQTYLAVSSAKMSSRVRLSVRQGSSVIRVHHSD
ncbi:hypothetical protein C8F01DRAFT_669902 [Mycena amicta]|nr:hypothetical protein C8F01DRAFT_214466 [Mycena amicta]KAJ7067583.1 hypothetical protein C8F01DRAFT_669902 [Mycena amicta]